MWSSDCGKTVFLKLLCQCFPLSRLVLSRRVLDSCYQGGFSAALSRRVPSEQRGIKSRVPSEPCTVKVCTVKVCTAKICAINVSAIMASPNLGSLRVLQVGLSGWLVGRPFGVGSGSLQAE